MKSKTTTLLGAVMTACGAFATVPTVSDVTMTQATDSRLVTITYKLSADAVITLDVQTNAAVGVWASIGGAAVSNAKGEVWRKVVSSDGAAIHTITWRPDRSWAGHKVPADGARAVVTAWATDNTPDYMVVDVSSSATANSQTYYPSAEFLPGGLLSNEDYRKSKLVMRKIMAQGVEWTMGSTPLETRQREAKREVAHLVTLTNNYYFGVFPVTQAQWSLIQPDYRPTPSYYTNPEDRAMRPVEQVSYNEIRNADGSSTANAAYNWPAAPNPGSFLGKLRTKTGLDFDLPGEAQWEFAARAGNGDTKWNNGSAILNTTTDENLKKIGHFQTNVTAIVGTYAPNDWGVYDTAGNVWEFCLDWYEEDITENGGKVNIDPKNPAKTLSGASGSNRVRKGGAFNGEAGYCRPAYHNNFSPSQQSGNGVGVRLVCTAGLR